MLRLPVLLSLGRNQAKIGECDRGVRIQLKRDAPFLGRLLNPPMVPRHHAQVFADVGGSGRDFQRLAVKRLVDRKSTRLNSSHPSISYAVFCLKKKNVWSPYTTDNPEEIPEDMQIKLLRKGKDVTVVEFGNEVSGGQRWLHYFWAPSVTYIALVGVENEGKGNTIYTAYFHADKEWKLIVSFLRPQTDTYFFFF